ncbi:V-type ATP synthase subunit I [Desulfurobacterium atlanticum]|uniref:V/A-type H+-transporting ATPase subunit I n=1 Tax=Desulfurobacterium atlanticum TaxID=240169 RepID=A0A238XSH8_9BACT|nr:V-type ATPase 116kDa subunit family protein [Desulfurobacterium atlanticum]SNR61528.1 V/A-type H+-transporting ATPase subunit I [Desulfurobacterium atlanticum]
MLFPEKMFKVTVTIPEKYLDEEIETLGKLGVLHIDDSKKTKIFESELNRVESLISLAKTTLDALGIREEKVKAGEITLTEIPKEIDKAETILNNISKIVDKLSSEGKKIAQKVKDVLTADEVKSTLKEEIDLEKVIKKLKFIKLKIVLIPAETVESLLLTVKSYKGFTVHNQLSEGSVAVAVFYTDDIEDVIEKSIEKTEGRTLNLQDFLSETKEKVLKEKEIFKKQKKEAIDQYGKKVLEILIKLNIMKKILETENLVKRTAEGYVVEGWIPESEKEKLVNNLKHSKVVFSETEDAPVLLKTPKLLKPFEELVTGFAYPSYKELNPTPFFALIFVLLFGVMFGDVGHGIVLAIAGYILSKKTEILKSYGKVLIFCGISSTIFGFLYGSIFGNEHLIHPLLFNPMEEIDKLIMFSLGVGVFVLSLGFLINIFTKFREKEYGEMIAGEGGILWFLIYWFLIGIGIKAVVYKGDVKVELAIVGILLAIAIGYEIYRKKQIFGSFLDAFMALLESITGTVSFVRLGAFALAHAALMLAIFAIGKAISGESGHGIGYWLVMIVGNIIVIVLEALVVSIQTMRLEYYEFFGKFFKGGGKPFKPFKLEEEK